MSVKLKKQARIKSALSNLIVSGQLQAGEKLPGERELESQFNASRGTIRQVLNELERENLVRRVWGKGTFVQNNISETIIVVRPDPNKVLFRHFWGKLVEYAHCSSIEIELKQLLSKPPVSHADRQAKFVKMFTGKEAVGMHEITANDIPWVVKMDLVEDITERFESWSQRNNIFEIAKQSVTYEERIYGLPFHSTLSALNYHPELLERAGVYPIELANSLEGFIRAIEKLSKIETFKYSAWVGSARTFIMHLLRAFFDNLYERFYPTVDEPIPKAEGIYILEMLHKLKWKYRVCIPTAMRSEYSRTEYDWTNMIKLFSLGQIPVNLVHILPQSYYVFMGMPIGNRVEVMPVSFSGNGQPFSLYNCVLWVINRRYSEQAKEFIWHFLDNYVSPQSEYELDRKAIEEDNINPRTNSFIKKTSRVPEDSYFDATRTALFEYAEREIVFPSPVFERFLYSAYRVLHDPDVNVKREYEFYRSLEGAQMQFESQSLIENFRTH